MDPNRVVADTFLGPAADAVVATDREGIIQVWNPSAERIFGHCTDQAAGQSLDRIIPVGLRAQHWDALYYVIATGEGSVANFSFQSFSYGDHSHRSGDRDVQRQAF